MNNKNHCLKINRVGFVLGAVLLVTLSESVGHADLRVGIALPVPVVVVAPPPVVVVAPPVVAVAPIVIVDDYDYYPSYGVYYNRSRHQYAYLDGSVWVTRPAPIGVSVDVLMASPSVRMDFHDSPERHHSMMVQQYPKNWKRAEGKADRNDDKRDNRDKHRDKKDH